MVRGDTEMVLNKYRSKADKLLIPFVKAFSGLSPNTLSAASVIFALLAGIALVFANESIVEDIFNPGHYIYIMFIIASICIFLNGFLDAVDGKVARITKRISKRGDFLDHALDRYADILILGGIMLSPYCNVLIGALAIIAVMLTSYMGTQAQALGCGRNYSGLLGRADRLVILIFAPLVQMWVLYYFPTGKIPINYINSFTILEYVMLWFFVAGNITALHRGVQSWHELKDQEIPSHKKRVLEFYDKLSKIQDTSEQQGLMNNKPLKIGQESLSRSKPLQTRKRKTASEKPRTDSTDRSTIKIQPQKLAVRKDKMREEVSLSNQVNTKHSKRSNRLKPRGRKSNEESVDLEIEWEHKPASGPATEKMQKRMRKIKTLKHSGMPKKRLRKLSNS